MGKIVITDKDNRILIGLFEGQQADRLQLFRKQDTLVKTGDIYIARVTDIVTSIHAAFASVGTAEKIFVPLSSQHKYYCTDGTKKDQLKAGDEILIRIDQDSQKSKYARAASSIDLVGRYCVCHLFSHGYHYSKKLNDISHIESALMNQISSSDIANCGFTIRTNVAELTALSPLLEELVALGHLAKQIMEQFQHRTCFTCLYHSIPEYIQYLNSLPHTLYNELVTDSVEIFEELKQLFPDMVRFYQDASYPLSKLYSIQTNLDLALSRKIWLPSGGYLIWDYTEAMTVIDVNSGKGSYQKGCSKDELYFTINKEAAREIAHQLRIRNVSGMILVDFINMEQKKYQDQLIQILSDYLSRDSILTRFIDITALGIVEITRKKIYYSITEFFS